MIKSCLLNKIPRTKRKSNENGGQRGRGRALEEGKKGEGKLSTPWRAWMGESGGKDGECKKNGEYRRYLAGKGEGGGAAGRAGHEGGRGRGEGEAAEEGRGGAKGRACTRLVPRANRERSLENKRGRDWRGEIPGASLAGSAGRGRRAGGNEQGRGRIAGPILQVLSNDI